MIGRDLAWQVIEVCSFAESDALLRKWGAAPAELAPAGLFKFPRTHHVLNAGGTGVSRDDLVLSGGDIARFVGAQHEVRHGRRERRDGTTRRTSTL